MQETLAPELFWLTATALMTGFLWVPYALNRMAEDGIPRALGNPEPDARPKARWAGRLVRAHANAVENLVVFAPLVFAAVLAERTGAVTEQAAAVYFFARAAHYGIYAAGIPVLRTLAFVTGVAAQVVMALAVLGGI